MEKKVACAILFWSRFCLLFAVMSVMCFSLYSCSKNDNTPIESSGISTGKLSGSQTEKLSPSLTGKLSGNVFVSMKSGDIKKNAGGTVLLLKDPESFYKEWQEMLNNSSIVLRLNELLVEIRGVQNISPVSVALKRLKELQIKNIEIESENNANVSKIIATHLAKTAQTDINGFYEFNNIPFGKYLIFSEFQVFDNWAEWCVPVEIFQNEHKVDLSSSNSESTNEKKFLHTEYKED